MKAKNIAKTRQPNQFLLTFYIGTISNISIFLLASNYLSGIAPAIGFIFLSIIIYILSFFLSGIIIKKIQKISIENPAVLTRKKYLQIFSLFFFISFLIAFLWFLAYNPGGFSPDSVNQYTQAISGNYNDWHPVLHTLLFFTIPISIFHNIAAIVICQIIFFSLAVAYAATTIYEVAGKKWSIISFVFITLNPWALNQLMFPWKDIAFGIAALLVSTITLKIYVTKGAWAKKISHLIFLAVAIIFAAIFRHNGILFAVPAIIGLFFFMDRKNWLIFFGISASLFFIIKVPLYSALNVTQPGSRVCETVGVPMTILANVAKENPSSLDEEAKNFLYSVAPAEEYKKNYKVGNFNSIKFTSNISAIDEAGAFNVLKYTTNAFVNSPRASLTAFLKITSTTYAVDGSTFPYWGTPNIANNPYDFKPQNNEIIKSGAKIYFTIFNNSILKYTGFIGFSILIIVIAALSKNRWKNGGWKKMLLISPILFYDFGTMLLLTGPEARFFYVNLISFPVITILALKTFPKVNKKASKK